MPSDRSVHHEEPSRGGEPARAHDPDEWALLEATEPARWLLDLGRDGVALTQTHALARAVVREAAELRPAWWDTELFGPPHREADLAVLGALHEGLRRLRLMRRCARTLLTTARGRTLAEDPVALLSVFAADLGGGDPFTEEIADAVTIRLAEGHTAEQDDLVHAARVVASRGWRRGDGRPPSRQDISWAVSDVLRRGEAYGIIERRDPGGERRFRRHEIILSPAAATLFQPTERDSVGGPTLIFDATLVNVRGVGARLAVSAHAPLTALHDAIQEAFGWEDDHLYSFWLDGQFWGDPSSEFVRPGTPDHPAPTADVPLTELDITPGAAIAYVFDYGDEWRVQLSLLASEPAGEATYPRVIQRRGTAPPQYPPLDEGDLY